VELQEGSKTELYQIMVARYYASSLGRFMAVDPGDDTALEDPQSWNKYAYVRNNPINHTDPKGMCLEDACIVEIGTAVAVVGPEEVGSILLGLWALASGRPPDAANPNDAKKPDAAPKPDAGADKKDDSDGSKKAKDRRADEQEADKSQRRGVPDWEPPASDREGKDAAKEVEKEAGGGDKGKKAREQFHGQKGPGGDRTKKELKEDKKIVQQPKSVS
jgi:RHS repeat-associated protein